MLKTYAAGIFLLASLACNSAGAINTHQLQITSHKLPVTLFSADAQGSHPAAILIHGYSCIEQCKDDYERYALALAKNGIDAYILEYYDAGDMAALAAGRLDGDGYAGRFKAWTRIVREAAELVGSRAGSNGRVALIGFSQGGRVAIASAANNPRIVSLAVFYARLPGADELNNDIKTLPPILIQHGNADTAVPLADGNALFQKAQELGGYVDMAVYPDQGHGFDFSATSAAAIEARRHLLSFIGHTLLKRE